MLERFTDRARKVMALANQAAQQQGAQCALPQHVLFGLVKEGSGVGANVLKNLRVDIKSAGAELASLAPAKTVPETPDVKTLVESALGHARRLNHNYVGTEHLLLACSQVESTSRFLGRFGLSFDQIENELLSLLGDARANNAVAISMLELLDRKDASVASALKKVGTTPETLRQAILDVLAEGKNR